MKVLWFTQNRPDGISVGRRLIAEHLRDAGLRVDQVRATPTNALRELPGAGEYDVVVGTTHAGALVAWVLSEVHRLPLVVDNIDPVEQFQAQMAVHVWWPVLALETLALRRADHVLYVYDSERERVTEYASAISQTDFGVNYEHFANPSEDALRAASERLAALPDRERTAIYVGGLNDNYHVREMIEAFESLPQWRLVILGTGALEPYVEDVAREREDVHFLGVVPHEEIPGYLHASDVGLCLIDDERTLKVLEYMAAALPTVQLDGVARERFGDRLTYADSHPDSIADAVARAPTAADDDELRTYAEEYSWRSIAEDYRRAIEAALGE